MTSRTTPATVVGGQWTPWLAPEFTAHTKSGLEGWWETRHAMVAVLYQRADGLIQCASYAKTILASPQVPDPKGCGAAYTLDYFHKLFTEVPADRWPQP